MSYSAHYYGRFSHYLRMDLEDVPLFRHIVAKFREYGSGQVLDVGCGLGYLLNRLTEQGWSGTGLDASKDALDAASRLYPDLGLVCGSAYDLPFADNSFEAVLSVATIEHLEHPEGMVLQMVRVLKPGGMLVISTPDVRSLYKKIMIHDPTHVHEFTREGLVNLLSRHGRVVDVLQTNMAGRLGRTLNDLLARLMPCDILVELRKVET